MTTTEVRVVSETGGAKGKKPEQMHHLDPLALLEVAKVAAYGGEKYEEAYNYLKGFDWSLSYDAGQRHLMLHWAGIERDDESKLLHLAHAAWQCLAQISFLIRGLGTDDRPKGFPLPPELTQGDADVIDWAKEAQKVRAATSVAMASGEPVIMGEQAPKYEVGTVVKLTVDLGFNQPDDLVEVVGSSTFPEYDYLVVGESGWRLNVRADEIEPIDAIFTDVV